MTDDTRDESVPELSDELDDDTLLGAVPDPTAHREWSPTTARVVLAVCVARYVVPILALGYAARVLGSFGSGELDGGQVVLLTLLRPAKETLLFAGGVLRVTGEPSALLLFAAYTPLMIVAVWVFFLLGRIHGPRLTAADGDSWLTRMVPPRYVRATQLLLVDRGPAIAILARIVAAPPTILAAAAGTAPVNAFRYLVADAIGGVAAFGIMLGLGLALGEAYERAGTPVTVVTFVVLLVVITLAQNWFQREVARIDAASGGTVPPATD